MKLSMEITSDMLIHSNLQRKHPENSMTEEKYLFIPALIRNVQRPHEISGTIQFGWCLQCSNPHQFFLPRFLHLLFLHFGYEYASQRQQIIHIIDDVPFGQMESSGLMMMVFKH